ncbi:MAG: substrate-binding domain-containing protein [Gammaproteobacteria bacterium]|nr:substrate-binding domain-containing protein [Gammaproteobacteria bacterium]
MFRRYFIPAGLLLGACLLISLSAFASSDTGRLIRLATTTSTDNSGLMDYLLPEFTKDTLFEVQVIAVGTGKALRLGREGDVDIVLVHARNAEQTFVDGGFGVERFDVMYNDFVLVGPHDDPAHIASSLSVSEALDKIHRSKSPFISRGDDSGTHKKEIALWQMIDYSPQGEWYKSVGQGMGKVIQIANELGAYTMTDRGTWLAYMSKSNLALLYQGDPPLFNPYGIIAVNPERHTHTNYAGASSLISWLTSAKGQRLIGEFKVQGEQLFIPAAGQSGQ